MLLTRSFAWLIICAVFLGAMPALAQTPIPNPTVAACGLPAQGTISSAATYDLTADCAQTGLLTLNADLTINGNGHTITMPSNRQNFIRQARNSVLNLNRVTIDGANRRYSQPIYVGTVNANQVSFIRSFPAILTTTNGTLNNVLFEWNLSPNNNASTPSTLLVAGGGNLTLNNAVVRNNLGGTAAIQVRAGNSITATGCLTLTGNAPYNYIGAGTFIDNSTGRCSGTIGNGDQVIADPGIMACGFPAAGNQDFSSVYTLSADC
ncbi:MAG: hypothetical protein OXE95_09525, partial [Chloroflexi bacterium]|nr:hypothetical protein [Chloroflexota bacterium]